MILFNNSIAMLFCNVEKYNCAFLCFHQCEIKFDLERQQINRISKENSEKESANSDFKIRKLFRAE